MGSDHRQNPQTHLPQGFNSRSRMGSDSSPTRYRCLAARFQFALPHGERHARPPKLWLRTEVSIRAPAWGATAELDGLFVDFLVSIRAPAWGATYGRGGNRRVVDCFNSRSRMGSDVTTGMKCMQNTVSIRAPAWGATVGATMPYAFYKVSIRAPAWGATIMGSGGARRTSVSIRAPAWGATEDLRKAQWYLDVSIRAPAWGATGSASLQSLRPGCFNSRSRMGSDSRGH